MYSAVKPGVLAHLRRYPHLTFSAFQLARVLGLPVNSVKVVKNALRSLERDGLVRHEFGTRRAGDYSDRMKLILWSLAEEGQS